MEQRQFYPLGKGRGEVQYPMKKYLIIAGSVVTILIIIIVIGIYALIHRTGNDKTPAERAGRQSQNLY